MPFGGDGCRIEVMYVTGFDPTVLTEGVIDTIFVVSITRCITAHVGAKFEGIISILKLIIWIFGFVVVVVGGWGRD